MQPCHDATNNFIRFEKEILRICGNVHGFGFGKTVNAAPKSDTSPPLRSPAPTAQQGSLLFLPPVTYDAPAIERPSLLSTLTNESGGAKFNSSHHNDPRGGGGRRDSLGFLVGPRRVPPRRCPRHGLRLHDAGAPGDIDEGSIDGGTSIAGTSWTCVSS